MPQALNDQCVLIDAEDAYSGDANRVWALLGPLRKNASEWHRGKIARAVLHKMFGWIELCPVQIGDHDAVREAPQLV